MLTDMEWMGIALDPQANQRGDTVISLPASRVQVLVLKTDEERMLAEHAAQLIHLKPTKANHDEPSVQSYQYQ
jgi:acetate kinase